MRLILLSLVSFCYLQVAGQTIEEDRDVEQQQAQLEEGPNTKYYQHGFFQLGSILNIDAHDSAQVSPNFGFFAYGSRGKLKITSWFAIGWDLKYTFQQYNIKQGDENALADRKFISQRFDRHSVDAGAHLRFNIDKRGNTLGKYVDVGVCGGLGFANRMKFAAKDTASAATQGSERQKTVLKRLQYVEPFHYGLQARVGFNRVGVSAYYRLSDLFKKVDYLHGGQPYPELPRLSLAFEINF